MSDESASNSNLCEFDTIVETSGDQIVLTGGHAHDKTSHFSVSLSTKSRLFACPVFKGTISSDQICLNMAERMHLPEDILYVLDFSLFINYPTIFHKLLNFFTN